MEYEAVISSILEAERSAREITREAREQEKHLQADLERETQAVRDESFAQAEKKLDELRCEVERNKAAELRAQDERVAELLAGIERAYSRYGDNWVNTLFRQIVGAPS